MIGFLLYVLGSAVSLGLWVGYCASRGESPADDDGPFLFCFALLVAWPVALPCALAIGGARALGERSFRRRQETERELDAAAAEIAQLLSETAPSVSRKRGAGRG